MKFILFISFLMPSAAFSEIITLKDGTKIEGEFEGLVESSYLIRTKYGLLSVKNEEILSPEHIEIKTTPEVPTSSSTDSLKTELSSETYSQTVSTAPEEEEFKEKSYELKIEKTTETINRFYLEDGIVIATAAYNLKNELLSVNGTIKDGKYLEYYPDGKTKSEKNFINAKEEGVSKTYYPSGSLQSRAGYASGNLDGAVFIYSPDGKLLFEQNYKGGLLDGWVREYDADGKIKKQTLYSSGNPLAAPEKAVEPAKQAAAAKKITVPEESPLTAKKIELARGDKYIIYLDKKQKAVLILDKNQNIVSHYGKLPDGDLKIINGDNILEKEFIFKDNSIEKLTIYGQDGSTKETYSYDDKEQAVKR